MSVESALEKATEVAQASSGTRMSFSGAWLDNINEVRCCCEGSNESHTTELRRWIDSTSTCHCSSCSISCSGKEHSGGHNDSDGPRSLEYPLWSAPVSSWDDATPSMRLDAILQRMIENALLPAPRIPGDAPRLHTFQPTGGSPRRDPVGRSKCSVPRWLINRVNTLTVMEKLQELCPEEARPTDCTIRKEQQTTAVDPRPAWSARTRRDSVTRQIIMWHSEVSAYASIKAEEIRTRRDNEAWVARTAMGLDMPIQDPLSLLGDCLGHYHELRSEIRGREREVTPAEPTTAVIFEEGFIQSKLDLNGGRTELNE